MAKRLNGEGSFIILPNGKVRMRRQYGYKANGKQRILTVTGTSKTDAINKMNERIKSLKNEKSTLLFKDNITLYELCLLHLDYDDKNGKLKDKSYDRREGTINNQIKGQNYKYPISTFQIRTVTPQDILSHIELLIQEGKVQKGSIEKTFNVINSAYNWAVIHGYIRENPCLPVKSVINTRLNELEKKETGVITIFSDNDIYLIKKYVYDLRNDPMQYLFGLALLLLLYTGMRVGELCALRWKDYYEEDNLLDIVKTRYESKHDKNKVVEEKYSTKEGKTKNYKYRTIKLFPEAIEIINEMKRVNPKKSDEDYIFLNTRKRPSNPSQVDNRIVSHYKKMGLSGDLTGAHTYRRTFATLNYNQGKAIEKIAFYMGDSPDTIREYYIAIKKQVKSGGKVINVAVL